MRRFATAAAAGALLRHEYSHCIKLPPAHEPREEQQLSMLDMWMVKTEAARRDIMPRKDNHFFRVYNGSSGEECSLAEVLEAMKSSEVVFMGETHDDPVAHQLQLFLLIQLAADAMKTGRGVALSLEMFETDVQTALDEYVMGKIRERDLVSDARPWSNYATDYRPMVDFCSDAGFRVVAANAPRRYVSAVGKHGREVLSGFPATGVNACLPPIPYPQPSEAYVAHFNKAQPSPLILALPVTRTPMKGDATSAAQPRARPGRERWGVGNAGYYARRGVPLHRFQSKGPEHAGSSRPLGRLHGLVHREAAGCESWRPCVSRVWELPLSAPSGDLRNARALPARLQGIGCLRVP